MKMRFLLLLISLGIIFTLAYRMTDNGASGSNQACAGTEPAAQNDNLQFCGNASFDWPGQSKSVDVRYEYRFSKDSGQGRLAIFSTRPKSAFHPFQFEPKAGQQFLTAIYPFYFGNCGTLLCTEWAYGASNIKLTVYRLNEKGVIEPVFDEVCRFGFRILDLTGGDIPNICGGYGDLYGPKQMKVFGWNGKKFILLKTLPVAQVHMYAIETSKK